MNGVRGLQVKTSDFSIARILAHDRVPKLRRFLPDLVSFINNENETSVIHGKTCVSFSSSSSSANMTFSAVNNEGQKNPRIDKPNDDHFFRVPTTQRAAEENVRDCSTGARTFGSTYINEFPWLRCTRYKPPKLPRKPLADKGTKRRPGLHPRIPFSPNQLRILEDSYKKSAYMSRRDILELSASLRLPQNRVKIWFQNRRARERRESGQSA